MGRHRHLFVDMHLLEHASNVSLALHPPHVLPDRVIQADEPWEHGSLAQGWGALLPQQRPDGPMAMYYALNAPSACPASECPLQYMAVAYAESTDGRIWHKPRLGLLDFPCCGPHTNLSRENNLVGWGVAGSNTTLGVCPPSVFVDPNAPPSERFKAVGKSPPGTGCRGPNETVVPRTSPDMPCDFVVLSSADGRAWTPWASYAGQLGSTDSMSTLRWSAASKRYQLYIRYCATPPPFLTDWG